MAGFVAELIGALFVGIWLLLFERHHDFGVFFDALGTEGDGSYVGAFLAASLLGLYLFYGFEACGDVAEEVPDPGRTIPKAMRRTIYVGGAAALLITAALILAQPDFAAIISGEQADPVGAVLADVFGTVGSKIITVIVLISFLSCVLSLQAAASRLLYSYARDHMIFASDALSRFSPTRHVPPIALTVAAVVPAALVAIAELISSSALLRVISFASAGIYIAFQMVVRAALVARSRGWVPDRRASRSAATGLAGEHRGADLRRGRRAQPRVAARGRRLVRQVDRRDRMRHRGRRWPDLHAARPPLHPQHRARRRRRAREGGRVTTPEHERLEAARTGAAPWKAWGPYLAERQWGTVREDYSSDGDAWNYFTHDQARSRAYRWGEDGIAGVCDERQRLCLALALWNGADPILKERYFGLTNGEGNHGEDAKEYWFYLDSTPTHSYMKCLYKYPQRAYPYDALVHHGRGRGDPELELLDTGVFDEDRYFDVVVEYAKAAPDDILMRVTVAQPRARRRAAAPAADAVVPQHRGRVADDRGWRGDAIPSSARAGFETDAPLLYTDNADGAKAAINDFVVHGTPLTATSGTKCAAHHVLDVPAGERSRSACG